jgi:hypothetical protein
MPPFVSEELEVAAVPVGRMVEVRVEVVRRVVVRPMLPTTGAGVSDSIVEVAVVVDVVVLG